MVRYGPKHIAVEFVTSTGSPNVCGTLAGPDWVPIRNLHADRAKTSSHGGVDAKVVRSVRRSCSGSGAIFEEPILITHPPNPSLLN